jgi:DNA-binding transcriptional regulator YdaS (Cro superfamily)
MAEVLERYMKENGISQVEMAQMLGVHQSLISQWVNKTRPIAPIKAKDIEEATGGKIKRHQLRPDIFDAPKGGRAA